MKPTTTLKSLPVVLTMAVMLPATGMHTTVKPYKSFLNAVPAEGGDEEKKPAKKTKKEAKTATLKPSLNNKVVKIYPDIIRREMHVVTKESSDADLDFYVFSTDGTLVQQYKMGPKEHKRISGLEKGKYVYRVFEGDEETATGQFEIR